MKYTVSLSNRAEHDREHAYDWYAVHYSIEFATRWFNGITRAMWTLQINPQRCPKAAESDAFPFDLYELHYGKRKNQHRILYRIHQDLVIVLHIRHSAQRDLTEDDLP